MKVGKRQRGKKFQRTFELLIRLAGKSDDDITTHGGVGQALAHPAQQIAVIPRVVVAPPFFYNMCPPPACARKCRCGQTTSDSAIKSSSRSGTSRGSRELSRSREIKPLSAIISTSAVRSIFGLRSCP